MSIRIITATMNTVNTAAFGKPATLVNDAVKSADFMPAGFDAKKDPNPSLFEPSPYTFTENRITQ